MIQLPKDVEALCKHLLSHHCTPIIVGGYIRDSLLGIASKDIDIEVFNVEDIQALEILVENFGTLNLVGKSFGVLKLTTKTLTIDFSLPRSDAKIGLGHKGFRIETNSHIDFKTAAYRRDFTMNAMGYDTRKNLLLDPYNGEKDLKLKILRCVSSKSFVEDPLRILRAIQFAARFELKLDPSLEKLIIQMQHNRALEELPKERIFEELKKLLLKAKRPSIGFLIMQKLNIIPFFIAPNTLDNSNFLLTLKAIDGLSNIEAKTEKKELIYGLTLLTYRFNTAQDRRNFLKKISDDIHLEKEVLLLSQHLPMALELFIHKVDDSEIRLLSTHVCIYDLCQLLLAINASDASQWLYTKAKSLEVLYEAPKPLLLGRHLIALGHAPSKLFSTILSDAYHLQLEGSIKTLDEALTWLKNNKAYL